MPSRCWNNAPPIPQNFSPVHITGPIDCLDKRTRLPVIIVEDLTLQVGDSRLGELADRARIQNTRTFLDNYLNEYIHENGVL